MVATGAIESMSELLAMASASKDVPATKAHPSRDDMDHPPASHLEEDEEMPQTTMAPSPSTARSSARQEIVLDSASESNSAEMDSEDDVEMRIAVSTPTDVHSELSAVTAKGAVADRVASKCVSCSARRAKSCENHACKRCCLRLENTCSMHLAKVESQRKETNATDEPPVKKIRKPVLKNEFKESNVTYYEETVTVFCVRDFFRSKQLSQGLLNDQIRAKRAKGLAMGRRLRVKRRVADQEKKKVISAVLQEIPQSARDSVLPMMGVSNMRRKRSHEAAR